MAENIPIIRIETGEAVKSVNDLKENIKILKQNLGDLEIGTEEYTNTLDELKVNQNALKDAMYATSSSLEDVAAAATGASDSYNSLVHRMAALKEEWRATNDEARRNELGTQIGEINQRLKDMDASVGNYQRNVGNYSSALQGLEKGFLATAGGAGAMINPIKGATMGLKTLSATPVIGILGLLANIISKVIENLQSSESNINAVSSAMSPFAAATDVLKNTMQLLGKAVAKVAEVLGNLATKVFPALKEGAELRNKIAKEEIELSHKQREAVEKNAEAQLEIAKLKAQSVDKDKYTAKERIAFLEQAMALELEVAKRAKDIAEQEYQLQLLQAETAENSKEENDKLAQAYANKLKAETDYFNKSKELTSQLVAVRKEEADAIAKAYVEEEKLKQKQIQINKTTWEERLKVAKKGSFDEYSTKLMIADAEMELEKSKARAEIKDADEKVKMLEAIEQKYLEKRLRLADEYADALQEAERKTIENQMNKLEDGSSAQLKKKIELKKYELDTIHQLETESDEDFYARKIKAEKDYIKSKEELVAHQVAVVSAGADATSALINSIADFYEKDEESAKKNAKKIKALRIASATIDMLNGAVTAFTSAQQLGPVAGPVVGGINAAAVLTMGAMNIAKIKSTNVESASENSGSSVSASVSAPNIETSLQSVRNVTTASEEDRLNQMASPSKVYILQSDIEASGNASKVQVAESSF